VRRDEQEVRTEQPGDGNWWTRPCGGREVLRLALPLVTSMISWTVMNFTDRMFLTWYSTDAMAAAMPAGMLFFAVACFPLGVASYVNTFVAQYHGARHDDRIGAVVWQGVWIGVLATPLLLATIPLAPAVFALAGHEPGLASLEATYYRCMMYGGGGMLIAAALSTFFTGRGSTRVVMVVDTAAAALNIALDYAWIFGHWGFPEEGVAGAAGATAVAQWVRAAIYWLLSERRRYRPRYFPAGCRRLQPALFRRLWRYGGPNGLQFLVESAAFTLFVLLVGYLGNEAVAATTLAFNVNSLAFFPVLGLGTAVTTMVAQQLGRNRPHLAARATAASFLIAMAYTGAIALLYVLVPDLFLLGYAAGARPDEFARLHGTIVVLLRFVAAYSLFDAMNIIYCGAIKGAGDTRFILIVTVVMSVVPVLVAWSGTRWAGGELLWCWAVLTGWTCGLGLIYLARYAQGRWRQMRVIEPELVADDHAILAEPAIAIHWGQTAVVGEDEDQEVKE
jgi:MATE family multidrug resistance protein